MSKTKLQKFEAVDLWRSEIKLAGYNPRKISPDARKRLQKNVKKVGLLDTIIVNKTTMNVVGGHQRLTILDEAEKYPDKDYQLTVALVNLTEQQEKEQNIFLNSKSAQGDFDTATMASLIGQIDTDAAGLTSLDLAMYSFNDELSNTKIETPDFSNLFEKKPHKRKDPDGAEVDTKAEGTNYIKGKKAEMKEHAASKAEKLMSYVTLNFSNMRDKESFMERFGLDPFLTFIDGNEFSEMCEAIIEE